MHALPSFEVRTHVDDDDCLRLALIGEIDLWTAHEAEQRLAAEGAGHRCLYVDLTDVTFMGAAAARFLVAAHLKAKLNDQRLVVVDGPQAHLVLGVTGLLAMLDVVEPESMN
jgi:anti-anti-sigma factor